jgi:hypothetical protein
VELALESAADKEPSFGEAVMEFVARVREAEQAVGTTVIAAPGSTVFTGNAEAKADNGGIAIGQAGSVSIRQGLTDPTRPGRSSR